MIKKLVETLIKQNKTISTMESCTGGGLVNAITNIPNASKIISMSVVTYSNEAKIKMGVSKDTINKYSVYSPEVAKEMAKCISLLANSSYGIGITGKLKKIDENNLCGEDDLVYYSIYDQENDIYYTESIKVMYDNRIDNKVQVIDSITTKLLEILNKN